MAEEEQVAQALSDDPDWYKDAIIYQLHIKSFFDSNNDGIGDFPGLLARMDYLAELGVNTIWLLPFYPSPRRDDGYDISDYRAVHPDYGTIADFKRVIAAAHERGIRIITELVMNHTSDRHEWFQKARQAKPGSAARNFYVWSDTDKAYSGTRIIFLDTEKSNWTWDEEAKAYYWHRFYSHQPDLNFDNPRVLKEMLAVMRFWLDLGIDGLRLDAVPYLIEREGTNNENLPETHSILKRVRAEVDAHYKNRMLLAEANQWPEDVQQYFGEGDGDECHMLFHFPLMPRMYMAIAQEDRFPITDIMRQTPDGPPACQWATFLRNHDELTLEMVTDKERDYLWTTYAVDKRARLNLGIRRRLSPLLQRDRRRIELMNSLLLTIMGTPILYYGDEIGMGDNIHLGDRDGVRTPMQWSSDRNGGFSRADPAALVLPVIMDPMYGYQAVNVEAQARDPHSLLNWLRRMLATRVRHRAFGRGTLRFLRPKNRKVLAYLREYEGEVILCVANVSRTPQAVELELNEFAGRTPVELSGDVAFPKIGQLSYLLTLPAYGFYWFLLSTEAEQPIWSTATAGTLVEHHTFVLRDGLANILEGRSGPVFEKEVLPGYVAQRRWYQKKHASMPEVSVVSACPLDSEGTLMLAEMDVTADGETSRYALPVAISWEDTPSGPYENPLAMARVRRRSRVGFLVDGFASPAFVRAIFANLATGARLSFAGGTIAFRPDSEIEPLAPDAEIDWLGAEQSNSTLIGGRKYALKMFRRLLPGVHTEAEMLRALTERGFTAVPALLGDIVHIDNEGHEYVMGIIQRFAENQGDGFSWSLSQLGRIVDDHAINGHAGHGAFNAYRNVMRIAGRRLGEMHVTLAQPSANPDFAPEQATRETIAVWQQRLRDQVEAALAAIGDGAEGGEKRMQQVETLRERRETVLSAADSALAEGDGTVLTRIHGDLHLGQMLIAAGDILIIDFEGEPLKPLAERRAKSSPLRDVAGVLRSFDYVVGQTVRAKRTAQAGASEPNIESICLEFGTEARSAFLEGYREGRGAPLTAAEEHLLAAFTLERAAYEIVYEVNNRPDWIDVPLTAFVALTAHLAEFGHGGV